MASRSVGSRCGQSGFNTAPAGVVQDHPVRISLLTSRGGICDDPDQCPKNKAQSTGTDRSAQSMPALSAEQLGDLLQL